MGKPLRVLMVEDSEDDALLTIRALKKRGYDPVYERVEDAGAMRNALEKGSWDVILLCKKASLFFFIGEGSFCSFKFYVYKRNL